MGAASLLGVASDSDKTKEQLLQELTGLRQRVMALEAGEIVPRRVDDAMHEMEESFHAVVQHSAYGYLELDLDHRVVFANPYISGILGCPAAEIVGRPFAEFLGDTEREQAISHFRQALVQPVAGPREYPVRTSSGDRRLVTMTLVPLHANGKVARFLAVLTDVTDLRKATEALSESAGELLNLIENMPDYVFLVDDSETIVFLNHPCPGMSLDEIVGSCHWDYIAPPFREAYQQACRASKQSRRTQFVEVMSVSGRWMAIHLVPLIEIGREHGLMIIAADITERKSAEEAVRKSEQLYRQLLAAVTSYTYSVRLENGVPVSTDHSWGCASTTGYVPSDYTSDPYLWINMVHPDDQELVRQHVAEVLAGRDVCPMEHRILHRNGTTRWVRDTIVSHCDDAGRLAYYDGLVEDITERKRAEERFRRLLESAPDGMLVVDQHGAIVLANDRTEQMFGYSREELLGRPAEILVPESSRSRHRDELFACLATPDARPMTMSSDRYGRRKDGSEFPIETVLAPLQMDGGALICCDIRDITERKRAEEKQRQNEAQLFAAQQIQKHLLPANPPTILGLDIDGDSYPAEFASGDSFDYLPMAGGYLGLVLTDVSGHGFAPSLLMASVHAFLRSHSQSCSTIREILTRTNRFVAQEVEEGRFITLLFVQLDPQSRRFTYVSAGHPDGYVLSSSGEIKVRLVHSSPALGVLPEAEFPESNMIALEPGDMLIMLTDGILEAVSPAGEYFGSERVLEVVRACRHQTSHEIIEGLYRAVLDFSQEETPRDDVTAIVIKVQPEQCTGPSRECASDSSTLATSRSGRLGEEVREDRQ